MSWSITESATDTSFEDVVGRAFGKAEQQVYPSPTAVRALRAIKAFVSQAPLNIPQGATVAFATTGHLDGEGRGEISVTVKITDTPPVPPPTREERLKARGVSA